MIHYIGDVSFFGSFFNSPPHFQSLFLFLKDTAEFKIRVNEEKFSNVTLFYVGDVGGINDSVIFHSGFFSKISYLFVQFEEKKRKEINKILSPETDYYYRHNYLKNLYKEIMDASGNFFVYSPPKIVLKTDKEIVLKDLSYFSLFVRKSIFKDEDMVLEKTKVLTDYPEKVYIADNKDNFIVTKK